MTIGEIKEAVNQRIRKDNTGNALSPSEFNSILKIVNSEYFKKKYGLPEEYEKGAYSSRQAWEVSRKISDDLRPFLISLDGKINAPLSVNKNGVANIPSDYAHVSSILYEIRKGTNVKNIIVEPLGNAQFNARRTSAILEPAFDCPVCTFRNGIIQFAPINLRFVAFDYLRKPTTPVYGYTVIAAEEMDVYNPATSTELEWPEDCHSDIVNDVVAYAADALRMQDIKASAEARKRSGQ
jgi:hypothetical protein